jgi:hypothetical protein
MPCQSTCTASSKFSPYSSITDPHHHEFTVAFVQMQADIQNITFYFRMKTGLKINNSGLVVVVLSREGLTVSFSFSISLMLWYTSVGW